MKAIWFSRHAPSTAQLNEIAAMGFELIATNEGMQLGATNMTNSDDIHAVISSLLSLASYLEARACFGVFAAPIQEAINASADRAILRGDYVGTELACYAAWNIARANGDGKPSFEHKRWCCVGTL